MAEKKQQSESELFMNKLVAFCQERGLVWGPSPEIYGGVAGFYDYGPLGKLLKNNVENKLRHVFVKHDFWEVQCPIVMPAAVWKASGHLGHFSDPVITCAKCGANFRVDKLIEEAFPDTHVAPDKYLEFIEENGLVCTSCGGKFKPEVRAHSLMMRTTLGFDTEAYNRPETATTTYLPFPRYFDYFRKKLPFGVFQIGPAFRNEISPRQFTLRQREFTQAEVQLFIFKDQKQKFEPFERLKHRKLPFWPEKHQKGEHQPEMITVEEAMQRHFLKNEAYAYTLALAAELFLSIGIPVERMRLRQHHDDEKAFYADDAWDIEVKLNSFGWTEMCGVHDRTDYDLKQHAIYSKKDLIASDETHKKEIPHILEIAFGPDRMVFAILDLAYNPKDEVEGKTTLHIPNFLAPIQVQIFPLVKKEGMPEKARKIFEELVGEFTVAYDESGTVGRRYLRAAQQGTPYCITVDGDTLKDDTVTLRDRDTEKQVRIKSSEIAATLHALLKGKKTFAELVTF